MKINTSLSVLMMIGFVYPGVVRAVDDPVPSKIKLSESVCVNTAPIFGQQLCSKVVPETVDQLKKDISHVIASYYEGKLHYFSDASGFCIAHEPNSGPVYNVPTPICNPGTGEKDKNYLGQSCGAKYCTITEDGVGDMADCKKEMSWFRGVYPQIWQSKLEKILGQIRGDVLEVHSVGKKQDGTDIRPCGSYAQAINDVLKGTKDANGKENQKGLNQVLNKLAALFRVNKKQISSDELQSCLKTDETYGAKDLNVVKNEAMDRSLAGEQTKEKNYISQAACNLVYAHRQLQYLFLQLSRCEIMTQTEESHYAKFASMDVLFTKIYDDVGSPCYDYARDNLTKNFFEDGSWSWNCGPSCVATNHATNCYQNGGVSGGGKRVPAGGIFQYMKDLYQNTDRVQGELNGQFKKNKKKDGTEIIYPTCGLLVPFARTLKRRRRAGQGRGRWKKILRFTAYAFVLLSFIIATGCSKHQPPPKGICDNGDSFSIDPECKGQWDDMNKKQKNCDLVCADACSKSSNFWKQAAIGGLMWGGPVGALALPAVCSAAVVPKFQKSLTAYNTCYDTQRKAACTMPDPDAGGGSDQTSGTLTPSVFSSLNNAQALFTDAGVITPPAKPDSGNSSSDTPSESAATEGGPFDKSETSGGTLADVGGNMNAPKFDMASTKGEGGAEGAADASNIGESGTQDAEDEKESALTAGAKTKEQLAYEAAGKGAGKQGSPFSGSKFGSDFDSAGKGASAVGFSRDPAGAAAGAGTGEEDPETYLARAGTDSLFDRVHPHFSRWGNQVQSGKWQSEFKRLGK